MRLVNTLCIETLVRLKLKQIANKSAHKARSNYSMQPSAIITFYMDCGGNAGL